MGMSIREDADTVRFIKRRMQRKGRYRPVNQAGFRSITTPWGPKPKRGTRRLRHR